MNNKMFQVSTLHALVAGYTRGVITVQELESRGNVGLGTFDSVSARSESAYHADHVTLKDMLATTQREFVFEKLDGTLVCVCHPDFMDGINAPGWHVHFLSADRTRGGHVFDLSLIRGHAVMHRIDCIEIQLPDTPAFDTYSLKKASQEEIAEVEQRGEGD